MNFNDLYVRSLTWTATFLAKCLDHTMKSLFAAQGKDLDQALANRVVKIENPEQEAPLPTEQEVARKLDKFFSSNSKRSVSDLVNSNWVNNPSAFQHPVLQSRQQLESQNFLAPKNEQQPPELTSEEAKEILKSEDLTSMPAWKEVFETVANGADQPVNDVPVDEGTNHAIN